MTYMHTPGDPSWLSQVIAKSILFAIVVFYFWVFVAVIYYPLKWLLRLIWLPWWVAMTVALPVGILASLVVGGVLTLMAMTAVDNSKCVSSHYHTANGPCEVHPFKW